MRTIQHHPPAPTATGPLPMQAYPFYVAVEAEDIEELVCVDLGWLQAVHHDDGGVGVGAVLRGRRSVSRAVALASTATTPAAHRGPHAMRWGRPIAALIVVVVVASLGAGYSEERRLPARGGASFVVRASCHLILTIIRRVVPQESRLPLTLVRIGIRIFE